MHYVIDLQTISERQWGYLIGFYIGDGNIFTKRNDGIYRLRFFLGRGDARARKRLETILKKLALRVRRYRDKDNTEVIEVHSKELVKSVSETCNKNGLKIKVRSIRFLRGFLEGLIDSDGYVQRNYAEITTCNEKLKDNIVEVLRTFRIRPNLRNYTSPISKKSGWRVGFSLGGLRLKPEKRVPAPQTAG